MNALGLSDLYARGFDGSTKLSRGRYRIQCSQCSAIVVNGTAVHEQGCPNATKECRGCDAQIPARSGRRYCDDCT